MPKTLCRKMRLRLRTIRGVRALALKPIQSGSSAIQAAPLGGGLPNCDLHSFPMVSGDCGRDCQIAPDPCVIIGAAKIWKGGSSHRARGPRCPADEPQSYLLEARSRMFLPVLGALQLEVSGEVHQ